MILIIDNYDSFTYNLVQMFEAYYKDVKVIKNNTYTIQEIEAMHPKGIVISPGPSTPELAGICLDVVKRFYKKTPILGICLGHQIIGQAFGVNVIKAKHVRHGKMEIIRHDFQSLYKGVSQDFLATRYHSLILEEASITQNLIITARATSDHYIMGIRHLKFPVEGVQFHPESYQTKEGLLLIKNFINLVKSGGRYV